MYPVCRFTVPRKTSFASVTRESFRLEHPVLEEKLTRALGGGLSWYPSFGEWRDSLGSFHSEDNYTVDLATSLVFTLKQILIDYFRDIGEVEVYFQHGESHEILDTRAN